jgi:hypothetical protein
MFKTSERMILHWRAARSNLELVHLHFSDDSRGVFPVALVAAGGTARGKRGERVETQLPQSLADLDEFASSP